MEFDVLLPIIVTVVVIIELFLHKKIKKPIASIFEDKKLSIKEAGLIVVLMGITVTTIIVIPQNIIQIFFLTTYSFLMISFTYFVLKKWYIAILPPIIFITAYLFYWELIVFNVFVLTFAIIITIYLSSLFSWKTLWVYTILLTIMDIVQVFGTGFMRESAVKMLELQLPIALIIPTYPTRTLTGLGLGDISLAGLLTIQTALKNGQKAGFITTLSIGVSIFMFELAFFNTLYAKFFPATIIIMIGWIIGIGCTRLFNLEL